jgi:hypothetical protein
MNKVSIVKNQTNKSEICNTILRSLPQWFRIESAIVDYVNDVKGMDTWVAIVKMRQSVLFR